MTDGWVIGLGEVLWDVFKAGPRFGGAPANFACHASALGARVAMVSAIGPDSDPLSSQAIEQLQLHGVSTQAIQRNEHETGRVIVDVDDHGSPTYTFSLHPAWDAIEWRPELEELASHCRAVCFGTLAQRADCSRATIQRFLECVRTHSSDAIIIFDVNLRVDFWSEPSIAESLALATVLKLNHEELPTVAKACLALPASGVNAAAKDQSFSISGAEELAVMNGLLQRFPQLKLIALTRGADGATLVSREVVDHCPAPVVKIQDTVGAGDAYTAALLIGLLNEWSLPVANQRAIEVAAFVCSQAGATPKLPSAISQLFARP